MNKTALTCLLFVGAIILNATPYFDLCTQLNGPLSNQNQYIQLENESAYDFGSSFTIELWMNVRQWDVNWQTIIAKGDNSWRLHRSGTTSNVVFVVGDRSIVSSGVDFVNQWHHLALVRNGNNLLMYIDGELNVSQSSTITYSNNNYKVAIGENLQTTGRYFKGKLDEIRIWSTVRSASEIKIWRCNRLTGTETGLLSYFALNSNSSTIGDEVGTTSATFFNYDTYVWQYADYLDESYSTDKAWQFSAGNERLQFASVFSYPSFQFTAEAWINPSLISATNKLILYHGDNAEFKIVLTDNTITASVKLSDSAWRDLSWSGVMVDRWYHVAYTVNTQGTHVLYINGWQANLATLANGYAIFDPGNAYQGSIGSLNGTSDYFKGKIDQVRIWNRALTSSEIWTVRHQDFTGTISDLLVNFQFNESTNKVIFNRSGNINCVTNEVGGKIASTWPKNEYYFAGTLAENTILPVREIKIWSDIVIPSTIKLTVPPGATLKFLGHYGILATGSLHAVGTDADSIRFTVADTTGFYVPMGGTMTTAGSWNGIVINTSSGSDSTLIVNCVLENGKTSGIYQLVSQEGDNGGAVFISNTVRYRIANSRFHNNLAGIKGGAIYAASYSFNGGYILNCLFQNNRTISTTAQGGAVALDAKFTTVDYCKFTDNQSYCNGGALYAGWGECKFRFNTFSRNRAWAHGGAVVFSGYAHHTLSGNKISNNLAEYGGGMAFANTDENRYTAATIHSNVITGNTATYGAGISFYGTYYYTYYGSEGDKIRNNTVADNIASTAGGGIYLTNGSNLRFRNSIIWGNDAPQGTQVYLNDDCDPHFRYCNIQDGTAAFAGAGAGSAYNGIYDNCINLDPLFNGSGNHPYSLIPYSPGINRGQPNSAIGNYDLLGNPRVFTGAGSVNAQIDDILACIDLGAYEDQSLNGVVPYHVTLSGTLNVNNNLTVPNHYSLTIAPESELSFSGQTGLDIYGSLQAVGNAVSFILLTAQNEAVGWDGLAFLGDNTVADTSYVAYCAIRNGKTVSPDQAQGGLIHVNGYNKLNVSNCILSHGSATQGGAIGVLNSSPQFYSCVLHHNSAVSGGGAVYVQNAAPRLVHLTVTENTSDSGAGGMQASSSASARLIGSILWNNGATSISGAMNVMYCDIQGGYSGSTNLILDPMFNPMETDRYLLLPHSPCLNKGITDFSQYPNLPSTDIMGNPRLHLHTMSIYNRLDIGAYEFQGIMAPTNFTASDGNNDYPGYVYLNWNYFGSYQPNNGFQIYRDGSLLVSVYPQIYNYADNSAVPGQKHVYQLVAYAGSEISSSISDTGYVKPNGIITGTVTTPNNNPVADVVISLSPSSGSCLQFFPSSTFEVNCPQADLSSSFTLETWVKTASANIDLVIKMDNSETHINRLRIDSEGKLLYTNGNFTLTQSSEAVVNNNIWHHVAVVYDLIEGIARLYLDGVCVGESIGTFTDTPGGKLGVGGFSGFLDDLRLWSLVRSETQIQNARNVIVPWNSPGLTGYWAMNEGSGTEVFDATNNANNAVTNASWSSNEPGIVLGGITNNWGEYVISQIPYGTYTTFTVTPSKTGHFFQPQQRLITLSQSNISANNVDFTDNSMIPISGRVMFQGTAVPMSNAAILLNGVSSIPPTSTDANGYYVLDVEHGTVCTLSVSYNGQQFDRVWNLGAVTFPQANKHFYNITRTEFVVEVLGGIDRYPIGAFNVTLQSNDGLYEQVFTAQPGQWSGGSVIIENVPPLNYFVTVDPNSQISLGDPFNLMNNQQFQDNKTQALDLRYPDNDPATVDTLSYIWRNEMVVAVSWPEEYELRYMAGDIAHNYGFYVVNQNEWIQVVIRAYEDYSTVEFPGRKTWLTNCDITINDEMGPLGESAQQLNGNSFVTYNFAPYLPSIIESGPRAFQKMLEITAYDPELQRFAVNTDWAVIQGARPQETTFATISPEIPFLILHDPPGDRSYSSFKSTSSHSVCISISGESAINNSSNITFHVGPDFVFTTGIMFSTQTEINVTCDLSQEIGTTKKNTNSYETKLTFTTSEEYKTSDDEQLVGRESDLFIGGALNLIWGLTKEVTWNEDTQSVNLSNSVMVIPDGFATHYIYTAKQIELSVIPNLNAIGEFESAALWQSFLDMNQDNIDNAEINPNHASNFSFNAGAGYTFEEENSIETSYTVGFETIVSSELGAQIGLVVNGVGVEGGWKFNSQITVGSSTQTGETTTSTMSYVLADNDETSSLNYQSDYFTVDIKKDPVYGTPVFNLLGGASSNRWEKNTLPRDGVDLSANTYTVAGLQEGQQAVFLLYLDNTSQTSEDRRYYLTLHHESNPGGATVKINGLPLVESIPFDIPPGQRVQAVMTVDQGPLEHEYEDITLELYAPGDRGNPGPEGHYFFVYKSFDVYWEPPYSKVSIRQPSNDWILNQADENTMDVILTGYDLNKPSFESILFQYKHPYDTNWLTYIEILRSELVGTSYILVPWDVSGIPDGEYEIRAGTTDAVQQDYYCNPIRGSIDRSSPQLLNLPQPSDGILNYGDQIVVQFTEFIDPDRIIMPNTITLEIIRTSTLVDVRVTRYENTVYLVPNIANYWIENETLRAKVSGLYDLSGNPLNGEIIWEFYVNANPVHWVQPKIELIKTLGQTATITTQLVNSGGQFTSFSIVDLPQWLTVNTPTGTLLPLDYQTLSFTISNQLGYGVFRETVYADIPALGREPLTLEINVLANPPAWATIQLDNYDFSMNITGQLSFDGAISTDTNDIIGAFVYNVNSGFECRGVAAVTRMPFFEDCYQFYLTVHSNIEEGEELIFRVWDSSTCKEHIGIDEEFIFSSGMIHGTPVLPVIIHVKPELISSIACRSGWNWISVNLENAVSMNVNTVLSSLSPSPNDIVKNQTAYAQYVEGQGWVGSLQTISTTEAIKLKLAQPSTMSLIGLLEDPETTPITYGSGWNWIGYLPHISLSVNQAMTNISNAVTGDLVKNQTGYSQYIAGQGWFGSMLFMDPGKGYMLKTAGNGSFNYPQYNIPREERLDTYTLELDRLRDLSGWNVNPLDYEYSSNITSIVLSNNQPLNTQSILLGAFYGDECRGISTPVWVVDRWVFFLTQYSNVLGQTFSYKVYFADSQEVYTAAEKLTFVNNQVLGDPINTFEFHITVALEAPENLQLMIIGNTLILHWDVCPGASFYKVFASDNPFSGFVEVTSEGVFNRSDSFETPIGSTSRATDFTACEPALRNRVTWTCELPAQTRRFYCVKAGT